MGQLARGWQEIENSSDILCTINIWQNSVLHGTLPFKGAGMLLDVCTVHVQRYFIPQLEKFLANAQISTTVYISTLPVPITQSSPSLSLIHEKSPC